MSKMDRKCENSMDKLVKVYKIALQNAKKAFIMRKMAPIFRVTYKVQIMGGIHIE